MRRRSPALLEITPAALDRLQEVVQSGTWPRQQVRQARMVLTMATGARTDEVAAQVHGSAATVWRACERFRLEGVDGLLAQRRPGRSARPW